MLIDWFTVGAQMLNFLILVWLLKRFLYKPVLDAIDARETSVASELAKAATTRTAAESERAELRSKSAAFDEQRSALFNKAVDEAKAERERLLVLTHQAADALRATYERAMREDEARLRQGIARMAQEEIFGIARKALADLAVATLEERVGEVFTRRLHDLDITAKELLAAALKASPDSVVRSAFEMPTAQKGAIQNALNAIFSAEVRIRFETSPSTICGIEWVVGEQRLAWSVAEYMTSLESKVRSLMNAKVVSAARNTLDAKAVVIPVP